MSTGKRQVLHGARGTHSHALTHLSYPLPQVCLAWQVRLEYNKDKLQMATETGKPLIKAQFHLSQVCLLSATLGKGEKGRKRETDWRKVAREAGEDEHQQKDTHKQATKKEHQNPSHFFSMVCFVLYCTERQVVKD